MHGDPPAIQIPADLLPSDGRFGSGPSKVRPEAVSALASIASTYLGTSHRRSDVKAVVNRLRTGLAELFSLPDGYEVLVGIGGTTLFWDAATFSLIERRSQHLAFGEFSAKFAAAVAGAPHLEPPQVIEAPPGTRPEPAPDPSVDLYALTHNETSTGVMAPVVRPASEGLVAVDATSAAGAMAVDPAHFDAYYFSPQKAFGSEGGLWTALCSPAALDRIASVKAGGRWMPPMLDLSIALENSRRDQTYNTPALATLFLLTDQVEWLLGNGGLSWATSRCSRSAEVAYGWAEASDYATPFVTNPADRSITTATFDLVQEVEADVVISVLRASGIVDIGGYRKLGRNQLRIGMWPAIPTSDVEAVTRAIDYVVERL